LSEYTTKEMNEITLGFIGTGQMAKALAHGIVQSNILRASSIWLSNPFHTQETIRQFEETGYKTTTDNMSLFRVCDIVILAVKPYHIRKVCEDLMSCDNVKPDDALLFQKHKPLLISVCAGVKTNTLKNLVPFQQPTTGATGGLFGQQQPTTGGLFGQQQPTTGGLFGTQPQRALGYPLFKCCRAMPNTPCLIGSGAVAVCFDPEVTKEEASIVKRLFEAVGTVFEVKEDQMDAVTGLSGSGPAFVYMMIEALSDAGVRGGLPRETALGLAAQTVYGSASMVLETKLHPAILKEQVTSPGGTTIEGVAALERLGFRNAVMSAVDAAKSQASKISL